MKRRTYTGDNLRTLIDDFDTLTEYKGNNWIMGYKGEEYPFTAENYAELVPQSPQIYREREQFALNEMRIAAGLPTKTIYNKRKATDIRNLLTNAGI
jgi:hypothetical protein